MVENSAASTVEQTEKDKGEVCREAVRMAYKNLYNAWVISPLCGIICVVFLWGVVPHENLLWWLAVLLVVSAARFGFNIRFNSVQEYDFDCEPWTTAFLAGAAVTGLIWGLTAVFIFPANSLLHQLFLIFIVAGLSNGVALPYSSLKNGSMAFSLPAFLPHQPRAYRRFP